MSDIFFEIYRRLLPTPPSHKVESRRNFPLKTFLLCLPVAWKFESFIILKCEAVFCWLGAVRRLEITVISRFAIICLLSNGRETTPVRVRLQKQHREPTSFSLHVARSRKLFTFVYLKFDICGLVCSNRRRTTVVTKGGKNEKGSKKRAR